MISSRGAFAAGSGVAFIGVVTTSSSVNDKPQRSATSRSCSGVGRETATDNNDLLIYTGSNKDRCSPPRSNTQPPRLNRIETEILSFSSIILTRRFDLVVVPSELRNQTKIKSICFGKINRHPRFSATKADLPPRPFILYRCRSGK